MVAAPWFNKTQQSQHFIEQDLDYEKFSLMIKILIHKFFSNHIFL